MDEQAKQVLILAQTVETLTQRLEQILKLQDEKSALLTQMAERIEKALENLLITTEAQKAALSDLDQVTDDLTRTAAALLMLEEEDKEQ